jgi:hypothetical protein
MLMPEDKLKAGIPMLLHSIIKPIVFLVLPNYPLIHPGFRS